MLWPNNAWCFGLVISDGWGGWTRKQPYLLRNHHPIEWAKNRSTSTASFESDAMWGLWIRNSMSQKSGFCDSDIFWLQLLDFMAFHPPGFWWISWWWPMGAPHLGSCVLRASNGGNGGKILGPRGATQHATTPKFITHDTVYKKGWPTDVNSILLSYHQV